jgi:hypothetical protein
MHSYLRALPTPDLVVFEDVQFSTYTKQAQLWPSWRTVVWLTFSGRSIIDCVPVATLKLFATGYGQADKALMEKKLKALHPEIPCDNLGDDAIDAIWIWLWAKHNLARIDTKSALHS